MNRKQIEFHSGGGKAIVFEVEKPKSMSNTNMAAEKTSVEYEGSVDIQSHQTPQNSTQGKARGEHNKRSFERFISTVRDEYKLTAYSVYYHIPGSDYSYVCGEKIISQFAAEDFMAISATTVFINPNGVFNDRRYKSQYITKIYDTKGGYYLIVLSSYSLETLSSPTGLTEQICDYFSSRMP